jgi:DNA polymerase-3 subunit chi
MALEVRFYHLQKTTLEGALPQLLQRTLDKGWRAVVKAGSAERVEVLNQQLWTYAENSFLPHGSARDGDAAVQPVWLTEKDENPNQAQVLLLVDGAVCEKTDGYQLICTIFDGNDPDALTSARADWKKWKAANCQLTYWQQADSGWNKLDT